jgi:hypothetical protein
MMTKNLLALFISLVLITSCRHAIEPIKPNAWRVRTVKTEFELTTYNYTNGQLVQSSSERLKKDSTGHLPDLVCTNYTIENGSLVQRTCGNNTVWNFQNALGSNGKIAEQDWAYSYRVNTYNNEGFLIEEKHYSRDPNNRLLYRTHKYEIINENVTKEWEVDINGKEYLLTEYEYHLDKLNTAGNENLGMTWQERSNKNLIKKSTHFSGNDKYDINYDYTFDSQNRVTQVRYNSSGGPYWLVGEYTYW